MDAVSKDLSTTTGSGVRPTSRITLTYSILVEEWATSLSARGLDAMENPWPMKHATNRDLFFFQSQPSIRRTWRSCAPKPESVALTRRSCVAAASGEGLQEGRLRPARRSDRRLLCRSLKNQIFDADEDISFTPSKGWREATQHQLLPGRSIANVAAYTRA